MFNDLFILGAPFDEYAWAHRDNEAKPWTTAYRAAHDSEGKMGFSRSGSMRTKEYLQNDISQIGKIRH